MTSRFSARDGFALGFLAVASILAWIVVQRLAPHPAVAKAGLIRNMLEDAAVPLDPATTDRLARLMVAGEDEFGVDALLVLAVIERESSGDPEARGPHGGLGLMQLRPETARAVARRIGIPLDDIASLFEPGTNVRLGTAYLSEMHRRFGRWELALAAYNVGPTRLGEIMRGGGAPPAHYARAVLERHAELEGLLADLGADWR